VVINALHQEKGYEDFRNLWISC